jgi:hypothetical protein
MTVALAGILVFLIGLSPDLIGMNRSPAVGFVQVGVWLTGLAIFLLGAYGALRVVRNGRPKTLVNDVGLRLAATGYVVAAAASLADFIGIGSHTIRELVFGKIQVSGLVVGVVLIVVGLGLYYPRAPRETSRSEATGSPARSAAKPPQPAKTPQPAKVGSGRS